MELILGIFLSGVVGGIIGQYKGRLGQGVVLGMLLGPIGWLCVLCGKDMRRTCAFCAESITSLNRDQRDASDVRLR